MLVFATSAFGGSPGYERNSSLQNRVDSLERQLQDLKSQIEEEKKMTEAKGPIIKKGTRFQYGGFVKADMLSSDYSDGDKATAGVGDDFLVPSTIPIGGESGDRKLDFHAKTSRLWFKTFTPTDVGTIRTHLEMDFAVNQLGDERISNSSPNRMRQAYFAWDYNENSSIMAGQSWATFFNVGTLPDTLDFVGPVGTLFQRQTQIRWTHKLTNGGKVMMSVENPSTGLYGTEGSTGAGNSNFDNNRYPDFVARYDSTFGGLSYSVAGVVREIKYKQTFENSVGTTINGDEEEVGGAISIAGKWKVFSTDDIKFQVNYGNALGRYMGLQSYRDGTIKDDGDIDLSKTIGGFIAYRHFWNSKWRSSLVLSASDADNDSSIQGISANAYQSVHANLLYSPTPKMTIGGEYIYANKEIEGEINGDDEGHLGRAQFSMKYVF